MNKIRLLLIEKNHRLRNRIVAILKPQDDISIIATSGDENNYLHKIHQFKPDVILLDLGLESQNGLSVVIALRKDFPLAKIIVTDKEPKQSDILLYLKVGASGFIFKDASHNNFLINIRTATDKSYVLPPLLVDSLFSQIVNQAVTENKSKLKKAVKMTKQEQGIIELLGKGLNNKEIGQSIHLPSIEVKELIHHTLDKLAESITQKLLIILKLMDLLKQFSTVNGWSIINLSAKYNLNKVIHSPRRANSFMILLPNNVTLFFYVSQSNKKLVSMQEYLSKRNIAMKEEVHKKILKKESVRIIKEKKVAKQEKKNEKKNLWLFNQQMS